MSFRYPVGHCWPYLLLALSLVVSSARAELETISLDDLTFAYIEFAELRDLPGWEVMEGGDITDCLLYYHDLDSTPPIYTNQFLQVEESQAVLRFTFTEIPYTIDIFPVLRVDLSRADRFAGLDVFPPGAWTEDVISYDAWTVFLSDFFHRAWEHHGLRSVQPLVEAFDNPPPQPAYHYKDLVSPSSGIEFHVAGQFIILSLWPEVAPYWSGGGAFSIDIHPCSVKTVCLAPFYPAPIWYGAHHDPTYILSPGDYAYFKAEVERIYNVRISDGVSRKMMVVPQSWDGSDLVQFNLNLKVRSHNDLQ